MTHMCEMRRRELGRRELERRRVRLKEGVAKSFRGRYSNAWVEVKHPPKEVRSTSAVLARLEVNKVGCWGTAQGPSSKTYHVKISRVAGCDANSFGRIEGNCGL